MAMLSCSWTPLCSLPGARSTLSDFKSKTPFVILNSTMTNISNRVLGAVRLGRNRDMGAEKRMNDIQAKVRKLYAEYAELSEKAMESYAADEDKGNVPFGQWVSMNVR